MSIYNKNGQVVYTPYDINGNQISRAYDINGGIVYSSGAVDIKVMNYNVGGWYIGSGINVPTNLKSEYESLQRSILSRNSCNICVFEEYWNNFCADGTTAVSILEDYYSSNNAIGGTSQYGGRGISMNFPIKSTTNFAFSQQSVQGNTLVDVVSINGHDVYIVGTHLDWQVQSRQELQVQELLSYLSDKEYFILCGDFNCYTVKETEDRTSELYVGVCKPFIDAGYNMANWKNSFIPTYYNGATVEDSTSITCIDNIITSANISVSDVYVDTTKLTDGINGVIDHIPIIATLEIT